MHQSAVFAPMLSLFLITAVVWLLLISRRIVFFVRSGVDPQTMQTSQALNAAVPDRILALGNNLVNLFELPVIFYVLTLVVAFTGTVDEWFMRGAWAYVALRALHTAVHCTYNRVMHRFLAYLASCVILWALVVKTVFDLQVF
jgi:hypothetical protein